MINAKTLGIVVAAFVAGSFVASPELRAYAANTIGSIDIINNSIQSVDIKDLEVKTADIGGGAVTNAKLANGAVNSAKIADNSITAADVGANAVASSEIADNSISYSDVSRSLIAVEHRDDCNCGGTGWDPNGASTTESIFDSRITPNSVVAVTGWGSAITCSTYVGNNYEVAAVTCTQPIPNGMGINYAIFNNPAYG